MYYIIKKKYLNHLNKDHSKHYDPKISYQTNIEIFKKRFWGSLFFSIPVLILSPMVQKTFNISLQFSGDILILFIFSAIVYFYGGWPFFLGFKYELLNRRPGVMTLVSVGITIIFVYSSMALFGLKGRFLFWETVTLIDILLLGQWLEIKFVLSIMNTLNILTGLFPKTAHLVKTSNQIEDIRINSIKKGDLLFVKPGEQIPIDGVIVEGSSFVDQSMITGNFQPVRKNPESKIFGGSTNREGTFSYTATGNIEEAYLSKAIGLIKKLQTSQSKAQKLADKIANWLTIATLIVALITFIIWLLVSNDLSLAILHTVSVIIIACPHAFRLAINLVLFASTAYFVKNGFLIYNKKAFFNSRKITTVVFNKTGTLTEGKFSVISIQPYNNKYQEEFILQYAASLESKSDHLIAKGIVEKAILCNISLLKTRNIRSYKGRGIEGIVNNHNIKIISSYSLDTKNTKKIDHPDIATTVYVIIDGSLAGAISLDDPIRQSSHKAIEQLKSYNITCLMVTGDNKKLANHISKELNLDGYYAEVLPIQKRNKIYELRKSNPTVAMVGYGVSNSLALDTADIGIAFNLGTGINAKAYDIALINNNPKDIFSLVMLSKSAYTRIIQNLLRVFGYNLIAIPLATGVFYKYGITIAPFVSAILMSLSVILIIINSKLLKFGTG